MGGLKIEGFVCVGVMFFCVCGDCEGVELLFGESWCTQVIRSSRERGRKS